ncbi:MAG: ATP-dependent RecD-like DNA helicase [Lachnospiraceae bacterium]|nr:ATP-dependent RecD-like DNA helicase [Lachnospiraceae bacterium]
MEQVKGYVEHIIYRNDDNGYTVMNLMNGEEEIVCVGNFRTIDLGETLEVSGNYTEHPMYGIQLKAESYRVVEPDDEAGMERYLASGAIKGIGAALASRIIKKFGKDTFRIIEEEPERLAEIKGISEKKAREIAVRMEEKKDMRSAMVFLQKYGISDAMAVRIYNTYGEGIYGVMRENPYRLAEDVGGIGFRAADEIARKAGIHMDSDYRIRSGILYALAQSMAEGNIYLPENILLERCTSLLEVDKEGIEPQISNLAMEKKIVVKLADEKRIYAASAYYEELNCAKMLHDLNISMTQGNGWEASEEKRVQQRISMLEKTQKIRLDELQKQAVLESIRSGIMILTGGPGTGKTTTINTMIGYFAEEGMDIFLAAPTGRAAKRMTEATGYEAKTIHRLLELNGASVEEKRLAKFERNEENPLEADVIIIDEMSMVDIHLFQALLKAIMPGTRLVMAGDINQLPPVGPGQVLRDLIDSGCFPKVMLQKIFRQAEESDIVVNAHRIHEGKNIALDNKSRDFFFLERNDVNVIYKHMVQLIREKLPPYVNAGSYDIQVLTPMRKGSLGVETLNGILQQYLNPPDASKEEHPYGNGLFRAGDKVMQIKNNYQMEWEVVSKYGIPVDKGLGVFNGDMGVIREINEFSQELVVEFDECRRVAYPFHQLDEIELAYAVTIHKSQGSEYPAVIMPLLSGPRMLMNRNLLYTGVTRAKYCVTILGSRQVVGDMIANESQNRRYTSLCDRIREMAFPDHR